MDSSRPALDVERLRSAVVSSRSRWTRVEVVEQTGSTNSDVARAARDGAESGLVVTAEHQVAGRGRLDRGFVTPARSGVVVSVLLRPDHVPLRRWVWLPLLTGLAVRDTVVRAGVTPGLKWPNDVLVDGRKICGILLERVETPTGAAAVLGIGLNVDLTREELPVPTATSLRLEGALTIDRTDVLTTLLGRLEHWLDAWESPGDPVPAVREEYRRACSTLGRQVAVDLPDGTRLVGRADDVDPDGRLVVDGRPLSAGDVTHVRPTS